MPRWVVLGIGFVILLAAACGDDDDGGSATPTDDGDATPAESGDATATSEPGDGDSSVVLANASEPPDLNPANFSPTFIQPTWLNVYEPLVGLSPDGEVVPVLASDWEQTSDTEWDFNLRTGVTFQNGDEFTAQSAADSINFITATATRSPAVYTPSVAGAQAVDEDTVRVTTAAPEVGMPRIMALFMMISPTVLALGTPEAPEPISEALNGEAIGTGPYELAEWNRGQSIVLTRWDGYRGEAPGIARGEWRFIAEDSTRLSAVQAGEVDIAPIPADLIEAAPNSILIAKPRLMYFRLSTTNGSQIANLQVRQALQLALDYDAIENAIYNGTLSPTHQVLVPGNPYYSEDYPAPEYDPDRAAQLVTESGFDDTTPLTVGCRNVAAYFLSPTLCQAATQMWEDAGLSIDLSLLNSDSWSEHNRTDQYDIFMSGYEDILSYVGIWHVLLECGSVNTYWTNCDRVKPLIDEFGQTTDDARKQEIADQIQAEVDADVPIIIFGQVQEAFGLTDKVEWTGRGDAAQVLAEITVQ